VDEFQQTVIVSPVEPGAYTVNVVLVSCGEQIPAGSTDFVFGAASAIPTLDARGAAALALLMAAVAVWRLR
jgi:hypothetical protein